MKRNFLFFPCALLIMISTPLLVLAPAANAYETGCGNDGDNDPDDCDCSNNGGGSCPSNTEEQSCGDGNNPVQVHKANLHRQVSDITTFGPAPIPFRRSLNSRTTDFNDPYWELGYRQTWQHNWNYEVRQLSTKTYGFFDIKVRYADGNDQNFKATDSSGAQLAPPAHNGDRLYRWTGSTVGYTLLTTTGEELDFKRTLSPKFQLTQVRNGLGFTWTCTYDANGRLSKVTNNFGRWIQIDRETGPDGVVRINRVSASDGRAVFYGYSPWGSSGKYVLSSVTYPGNELASYDYATSNPNDSAARPVLATAADPTYKRGTGGAQMKYVYNYNALSFGSVITGSVLEERSGVTDQKILSLPLGSGNYPQVLEGDGTEVTRQFSSGHMNVTADGEGRTTTYTRDAGGAGYLISRTDPDGGVTSFTRDYAGRVLFQTDALGHTRSFSYNAKGFVLTKTDELGHTTTINRDTVNSRPLRVDYADGNYEIWTYDGNSLPLTHRLRNGGNESFVYDASGNLTSHTDVLGHTKTYTYYTSGLLASVTDERQLTTAVTYDWRGNILTITHPDNKTVAYTYDTFGNRTSVTDELGHSTIYSYDEYNRLSASTDALNRTTVYQYGVTPDCTSCGYADVISRIISPGGRKIEYQYDHSRLRTFQTVGAGTADAATTGYSYDSGKNLVTMTDPRGKVWHFGYDARHRRTSATDPLGHQTQWTYDDYGNKLTETRPDGGVTHFQYDNRNRLIQTMDPLSHITQMTYDNADNLLGITDARQNTYSYTYDLLNRKTSSIYPDGSSESYGYDIVGNLGTYTTREGQIKTSTYDNRNREIRFEWNDTTPAVDKTYDAAGRLLTMTSAASALSYTYDAANQLTGETQQIMPDATPMSFLYTYDQDGLRFIMSEPSGGGVTYEYNARGATTRILDGVRTFGEFGYYPPVLADYTYDVSGNRLARMTQEQGAQATATYAYDDANRLSSVDHQFARFDYTYDIVGNRTSRKATINGDTSIDAYGYDGVDQLTQTKYNFNAQANTHDRKVDYAYDAVGNRTNVTDNGVSASYTANNLNQYAAAGGVPATYSSNGNLTGRGGWTYAYDAQKRLTSATSAQATVTFVYDARNRCVKRTVNGVTILLYYDGWNLVEEHETAGGAMARYVHGPRTDELLRRSTDDGDVYYHQDALGSTVALTNNVGAVVERYTYDVYGAPNVRDGSGNAIGGSAVANRFLFAGREYLPEIGLYDQRNRFYSPSLGRFLQPDSLQFGGGDVNLYRYARNNPANRVDTLGLCSDECQKKLDDILRRADELQGYIDRYDEVADTKSWPSRRKGGMTKPGGHYDQIQMRQSGLQDDIDDYNENCLCDDDPEPCDPVPDEVADLATQEVPEPAWDDDDSDPLPGPQPGPAPSPAPNAGGNSTGNSGFMNTMSNITGLTGGALLTYVIISEGSRIVFPPRNLVPIP